MSANSNRCDEKDSSGNIGNASPQPYFCSFNSVVIVLPSFFFEAIRPDFFQNISGNYESKKAARL